MSTGINIAPSSDLTVGTTAVTSGTDTRVFFQAGGVVQQDANFTFDNTLKRLTLKAVGTAATDIPFAVQNSAGTNNTFSVLGNGTTAVSNSMLEVEANDVTGIGYTRIRKITVGTFNKGSQISLFKNDNTNNIEIIRLEALSDGGITLFPEVSGTKSVTIGNIVTGSNGGVSMYSTGVGTHNIQIANQFHNIFQVQGTGAQATFRVGNAGSNVNFFNVHGRNAGGTGLTTNPVFTINSSGTVGIGTEASTPGARLDVRAQGALSTDIAFRVRNSADTYNMSDVQGDSIFNFRVNNTATSSVAGLNLLGTNTDVVINARSTNAGGSNVTGFLASGGGGSVGLYTDYGGKLGALYAGVLRFNTASTDRMNFVNASNNCSGWAFLQTSASTYALGNTVFAIYPTNAQAGGGTLALGTTLGTTVSSLPAATYGKNTFFIANGTAPTTTGADAFGLYSEDITAGNAAPHFRTENGDVIKLYKNAAVTTSQGIADALTNLGVLTASTIAPSVQSVVSAATVTPTAGNDLVVITAQAAALTVANPTGTWPQGKDLMIRIKDDGTARAITWDTNYRAIGVTLPTTTVINKTTYVGIIYNSTDGKWDVIGVTTEA